MDNLTKKQRSFNMSRIRASDTKLELFVRKELSKKDYKYRKNVSRLPGKPDIAFINRRLAIFLDSCFWHGCRYHCRMPATNVKYWKEKIASNKKRDKEINQKYKNMGWKVLRFWEHQIKKDPQKIIKKIEKSLQV